MAQNIFNYFSFISLAMAALLLLAQSTVAENPGPINKFCKTAEHKQLCTKMVNGEKNPHDASKNAMQYTLSASKKLQSMMNLIKPAMASLQMPKVSKDSIFNIWKEDLESKVDDLEAWDKNGKGTVLTQLSAA